MTTLLRASCATLLLLTSCATPNVNTPSLSAEDVQRERYSQAETAKQQQGITVSTRATSHYVEQLKRIAPRVQKAGIEVCQAIDHDPCEFGFKLVEDKTLNASADGTNIHITTGIMAFAGSDDAVASVLSHEYAHNVLSHVASTQRNVSLGSIGGSIAQQVLQSRGIEAGDLSQMGAQFAHMRYSKAFEQEADHVGLYIAERAGFNIESMPDMWRRMASANPDGIYTASTHPTYPERYIAMQQAINEIRAKKTNGDPLLPTFQKKKRYF